MDDVVRIFEQDGLIHNDEERERTRKALRKNAVEPEWYDHFIVAEYNGKVVGRVLLEVAYPPYSELINLYVLPDYRGIGVGSNLVQRCTEIASMKKVLLMSTMTDPAGNLPAYRLYSKFGFRPGILGDPSAKRGHMWLFRFSEDSFISEFLKRHPFAEPSASPSKLDFHDRMLYRMSWRDPQTGNRVDLFIEGQPSQTPEGTMPRIAGFSYKEEDLGLEALVKEQDKVIRQGETSEFAIYIWNLGSKSLPLSLSASIPDGTILTPLPQTLSYLEIDRGGEKIMHFKSACLSSHKLPDFTSFPTMITTCHFMVEGFKHPLFASAGFEKK